MRTFSETEPPLICTSIMCAFFCLRWSIFCWVWHIARTTEQYFFIWFKSFSISFLPKSSFHFNWAFEKAFFLDLDLIHWMIRYIIIRKTFITFHHISQLLATFFFVSNDEKKHSFHQDRKWYMYKSRRGQYMHS